jgi:phage terminase large subunit-like protein
MTSPKRSPRKAKTSGNADPGLARAEDNIEWIETNCIVPQDRGQGQSVRLREWQRAELRKIYGNPHGTRRAILSFGRKNGKTALVAWLLLLHLCGPEAKLNSQLYSAATSKDQAAVVFKLAAKTIRSSPSLNGQIVIRDTVKELAFPPLGTLYKALSAEGATAYGLSPAFIVHDELGQVRGERSDIYDALETATGTQDAPLTIIISTQAPTDAHLLSKLIDKAKAGNDPHTVLSLYTAPEHLDPFSEEAIRAANPAFGDFQNAEIVLGMAREAKEMPSAEASYRNLVLNQRVEVNSPFISKMMWERCGGPVLPRFDGLPVYGGLDLSSVADLTALVLVTPVKGIWHVKPTFWLPGANIAEKSRKDMVPYDLWAKEGHLQTPPGPTVDYDFVAEYLRSVFDRCDVIKIAFDAWNWRHFKPCLIRAGFTEDHLEGDRAVFEPMRQNYEAMSPALRDLESAIRNERLVHGMHPVLKMCAGNATVISDGKENRMLTKAKSQGRIDGMVALAMAMSVAGTHQEAAAPPTYQMYVYG